MQQFPFEEFGLDLSDLVRLLTRAPSRASAFMHAVLNIGRQYDLRREQFWLAALRSYQEINENYFPEVEEEAAAFMQDHAIDISAPMPTSTLRDILEQEYSYELDETRIAADPRLATYRTVFVNGDRPRLLLNSRLQPRQIKFLLAREIGYCVLDLTERSRTSTPDQVSSFQQVLNDFMASYLGGALLMPRTPVLQDIQAFFDQTRWDPQPLLGMLTRYDVTTEMLLYRFSELAPERFGVRLHFLRFHDVDGKYRLYKQLHMNNLMSPSGIGLHEHHCRRWLSVRLLRDPARAASPPTDSGQPWVGVQKSEFLASQQRFLCLGFARQLVLQPDVRSSVIVGFQHTPALRDTIRFVDDPAIPHVIINETCERCPLLDDQCAERGAPPTMLTQRQQHEERRTAVRQLLAELNQ